MPYIVVENLQSKTIDCSHKKERLLDILLESTDWMHACGGKGRCTTCRAIFLKGQSSLGELTVSEQRFVDLGRLQANERMTCQVYPQNEDLVILVPESSKLPHIKYSK